MDAVHPRDVPALNALIVTQQQEQPVALAQSATCIPEGVRDHPFIPDRSNAEVKPLRACLVNHIRNPVEALGGVPSLAALVKRLGMMCYVDCFWRILPVASRVEGLIPLRTDPLQAAIIRVRRKERRSHWLHRSHEPRE
jgi:hypothetical protein